MLEYLYCFQQEADVHYKAVNKWLAMFAFISPFALIFGKKSHVWSFLQKIIAIYNTFSGKIL